MGEKDVEYTLIDNILFPDGFVLFLNFLSFLLVFVFHLEYLLGSMLVLSPEFGE